MKKAFFVVIAFVMFSACAHQFPQTGQELARNGNQGCCSSHKGVCGCEGGRVKCCDGSFSPSCGCTTDSNRSDIQ